jgi:hypothetical protein
VSRYYDGFGDSTPTHPLLEQFVCEWVDAENARIAAANDTLAAQAAAGAPAAVRVATVQGWALTR